MWILLCSKLLWQNKLGNANWAPFSEVRKCHSCSIVWFSNWTFRGETRTFITMSCFTEILMFYSVKIIFQIPTCRGGYFVKTTCSMDYFSESLTEIKMLYQCFCHPGFFCCVTSGKISCLFFFWHIIIIIWVSLINSWYSTDGHTLAMLLSQLTKYLIFADWGETLCRKIIIIKQQFLCFCELSY